MLADSKYVLQPFVLVPYKSVILGSIKYKFKTFVRTEYSPNIINLRSRFKLLSNATNLLVF